MFERLGSISYRYRFAIIVAWAVGAVGSVLLAPTLATEGMTDQAAFLPADSASTRARGALESAFPGATSNSSATLTFSRDTGLTDADHAYLAATADWATSAAAPPVIRDAVTDVATADTRPELASMLRSDDGRLEMMTLNMDVATAGSDADAVVTALRTHLADTAPDGLATHVTGAAAISSDYLAAIVAGTESTTIVTVVLVVVLLLLIYRAPLAAMVPLATIGMAYLISRGVLGILAAAGWRLSSLVDTFVVVMVFGVGTDYAIFLISRFREEVAHDNWHDASRTTVRRIGAVISASAATVIVGLGSMAFAEFGMIQSMGPALAVTIFVTLVAGLTLTPALLAVFGHYLFWPRHAETRPEGEPTGFFASMAAVISRHPGTATVALLVVLLVPAAYMGQMRTNFDVLSELPASSDARAGFDQVAAHLGKGKLVQATGVIDGGGAIDMLAPASLARLRDLSTTLVGTVGVATVTTLVSPDGDGVVPDGLRPSRQLAEMADGFATDAGTGDAASSEALLDDEVSDGLDTASEYLALLGNAFPEVAAGRDHRTATARLATARDQLQQIRDNAVVTSQLRSLSGSMTSASAAAGGGGDSVEIVGDYLDELAAAFPQVRGLDAFTAATEAAAGLEREVSITAALDLSSALSSLATWFDDNLPGATLFPDSLSRTSVARQFRAEVEATFDALPDDLAALAATFESRSDDVFVPVGLSGEAGADVEDAVGAFVSDDRTATRLWLTTVDDPYSQAAFDTVRRAQGVMAAAEPGFGPSAAAHLGGPSAEFADVQTVLGRDFQRVAVITILGVLAVLVLLLRAMVAPLYLVATVLLSCATALGLSAWWFQEVRGDLGVSFYLPLIVFVLLVALGSDYNIFLMSRVREESEQRPMHDAIRHASGRTGAVITSAGLILAGTFASMATAPLAVLLQVGIAVAAGVLIDTFLVRSMLVPAITTLVGERAWWPFGPRGLAGRVTWPVVISVPDTAGAVGGGRRRLAVAVGLAALVPMLFAGLTVWSLSDPTANLSRVTAAIVNEDLAATATLADGTPEALQLGTDLADRLAAGTDGDGFTWRTTDAADARDGLAAGRYGAVLTIPSDFSSTIAAIRASTSAAAGSAPEKATLGLATNEATSFFLGTVADSLSRAIAASTGERVTSAYVDDVLLAVSATQGRVSAAASDAGRVAAGSTDLAAGAGDVSLVAGELVTGLEELSDGASTAGAGLRRLANGVRSLADGADQLADGAAKLDTGARKAATGAGTLAGGVEDLSAGLDRLAAGTSGMPGQADQLSAGAAEVANGAAGVASGVGALADSLAQLRAGTSGLGDQAQALDAGAAALAAGADELATGAAQSAAAASGIADGAHGLATSIAGYADAVSGLAASCASLGGGEPLCSQLAAVAAGGGPLAAGAASLADGADQLAVGSGRVAGGASDLAAGSASLRAGTRELAAAAPQLEAGIAAAAAGAAELGAGAADLSSGAQALAAGTATLAGSVPALVSAVSDAAEGAQALAGGADAMATGVADLADGTHSLALGARKTADGGSALAAGTSEAAGGASQLTEGVAAVVAAGRLVEAQADGLAADGEAVASDATSLAGGLEDDAAALPSWPDAARSEVGAVVASPVAVDSTRLNAFATTGAGLAPYFMALALWLGGLATFLVLPALPDRDDRTRWWLGAMATFLVAAGIAAVQALLMVVVLRYGVGISVARLPELFLVAVLAAVAGVAVVQAVVALLGRRGWFVALLLLVLQLTSAGAWFPIETAPALFRALHPLLPMSHAVDALRTLVAGGDATLLPALLVTLAWTIGALLVTLAAARLRAGHATGGVSVAAA